jgi:zinc/manganese transport system substrate-binding protein
MVLSRRRSALVVVCGALATTSCGSEPTTDEPAADAASDLVATTSIWADITSQVVCGEPVPSLIPAGADPHSFEASLRDRELLDDATVIIANGGELEGTATELLVAAESGGTAVIEMLPLVEAIDGDPHLWQDPTLVADLVDDIQAAAFTAGFTTDRIEACAGGYRNELIALDAEIAELLAPLPPENRLMVTSHDSLAYFAERYDLEIVGTVIPSTNTLAETNAADLAALADTIETLDVAAVFTEQLESSSDADRLAERLDVDVVPLVTDALTDDPAGDTYVEMMRSNATTIAEALAP